MISFPNAKINLGLHITAKRPDGFHELETVFYPIGWSDMLELVETGSKDFEMTFSGLPVPGAFANNLCYKAWQLIKADHKLPNLQAHLHKIIPMGAGLGGGSSDAAFMLKLINDVCNLKISNDQLKKYATQLGSDCAFFIDNKPMLATGRGEILNPIGIDLCKYKIAIVMPQLTVGTAEAYSWITPSAPRNDLKSIIHLPGEDWKGKLVNDFEEAVFKHKPEIAIVKQQLYDAGAIYASMSGSGAAVYGVFNSEVDLKELREENLVWSSNS